MQYTIVGVCRVEKKGVNNLCVCVCERERERESSGEKKVVKNPMCVVCLKVSVCVCERESERSCKVTRQEGGKGGVAGSAASLWAPPPPRHLTTTLPSLR